MVYDIAGRLEMCLCMLGCWVGRRSYAMLGRYGWEFATRLGGVRVLVASTQIPQIRKTRECHDETSP